MKQWILASCLLGICSALPIQPQHTGIPGMGGISLETMRQLGGSHIPNLLSQVQHYSFADPFYSAWIHNFLPSHSSYPWMIRRPQVHETQQYEYSMPVHPPPLPSQQTPQPGIQEQIPFQFINQVPPWQVQLQLYGIQPPFQKKEFPQPEGNQPVVQQPLDKPTQQIIQQDQVQPPQQQFINPKLYYMPYEINQGGTPARLGIVSSEEMQGGRLGGPMFQAMGLPDHLSMNAGFGTMPQKFIGAPGDLTVEDDQLGITEQPDVQGGAKPGANPSGNGNNVISLGGHQGGFLPNANGNLLNPAAQSKGPQATAMPLATQGFPDNFVPFEADPAMPVDPTMFPDTIYTTHAGNEVGQPQVGQDLWRFQEP